MDHHWNHHGITKVGPELWRLDVPNARRARAWVRGWVEPETQPPAPCAAMRSQHPLWLVENHHFFHGKIHPF